MQSLNISKGRTCQQEYGRLMTSEKHWKIGIIDGGKGPEVYTLRVDAF